MAGSSGGRKGSGRSGGGTIAAPAKAVKATDQQRSIKAGMDERNGLLRSELKRDADALRTRLSKKLRDATGSNTVGGAFERLASGAYNRGTSRTGMSRAQQDQFMQVLDASGRGGRGFQGVRLAVDQRGNRDIQMTPMARRQAQLAEKAGSRKRRR